MPTWLRWISICLAQALALACYLGLFLLLVLPALLEAQQLREALQERIHSDLGYTLDIGSVQLSYRPGPVLELEQTSLDLPQQELQLSLPQARLELNAWELFQGRLGLRKLVLQEPRLSLPWPEDQDLQEDLAEDTLQNYLQLLPRGLEIELDQGRVDLLTKSGPGYSLENLQLQASLERTLQLQLTTQGPFWQELGLDLQLKTVGLKAEGHLSLQGLDLHLPDLPLELGELQMLQSLQASKLDLDFQFQGLQDAQGQLQVKALQAALLGPDSSPELQDINVQAGWSWQDRQARLELQSMLLPQPDLRLSGSAFWQTENQEFGFDLQGGLQDVAYLRQVCLGLWPDNEVLGHIFRILRQGRIPQARARARGQTQEQLLSSLKVQSELQAGQVRIQEADLELEQASGKFSLQDKTLLGRELQASAMGSRALDGDLELGLNSEIRPFKLQTEIEADLAKLPRILRKYLPSQTLQQELDRMQNIQGQGRARLGLHKRHKQDPMQVQIQARDFRLQGEYSRLPLPVNIRGGKFNYQEQSISLQDIELFWGSSQAKLQQMHVNWPEKPEFELQSQGMQLELQELMPWLREQEWAAAELPEWEISQGRIKLQELNLQGPLQEPRDWDYHAQGRAKDLLARSEQVPWAIQVSAASFDLGPEAMQIQDSRVLCGDSALQLQGSLQGSLQQLSFLDLQLKGAVSSQGLHFFSQRLELPKELQLQGPLQVSSARLQLQPKGPFSLEADLLGPQQEDLKIEISKNNPREFMFSTWIKDQYSQAECRLSRKQNRLELEFQGHLQGASLDGVLVQNRILQGGLQGELQLSLLQSDPALEKARGNLQIQGLNLPLPGTAQVVRIPRLQLQEQDGLLQLESGQLEFLQDSLQLQGHLAPGRGDILELEIQGEQLHWPQWKQALEPIWAEQGQSRASQELKQYLQGLIKIRLQELILQEYTLKPLLVDYRLKPGSVQLKLQNAGLCGIMLQGNLSQQESNDYALDLDLKGKGLELANVLNCLGLKDTRLEGEMQLQAGLDSRAKELAGLRKALQGELDFIAQEGKIHRMQLLTQLISILNTTEVFFGTNIDLEQQGLAYNRIEIQAGLEEENLQIKKGLLNGETLEMAFSGDVDLDKDTLEMFFLVAPLKTLDRLVKKIPVLSSILGGNLVVVPIRVSGDLEQPRITPMSPTAVSHTLLNILTRSLQVPVDLLEPLLQEKEPED
ncbi:MAG: AsmA-like C-terminal domain-containing protein [Thermodesulfobacteriota bacterium]